MKVESVWVRIVHVSWCPQGLTPRKSKLTFEHVAKISRVLSLYKKKMYNSLSVCKSFESDWTKNWNLYHAAMLDYPLKVLHTEGSQQLTLTFDSFTKNQ